MSRVTSIAWLGWRFVVVQPLRKALRRTPALERFGEAYFPDGCLPTPPEDRDVALAAAACTGCGLCESRCPVAEGARAVGAMGIQSIMRLHAKHLGEIANALPLLAPCRGCGACDAACPSGVPISRIVAHLHALATRRAGRARGSGGA